MKILHVIGSFDKKNGGTYSAIASIADMERRLGHESSLLSIESVGQEYDNSIFDDRLFLFASSFPARFGASKKALRWLQHNVTSYDLLVLHEVWTVLAVQTASMALSQRVKYIVWPHGSLDPFDLQKKKYLKKVIGNTVLKKLTAGADAICCTSPLERDVLETYNKRSQNIQVLPLPIDCEQKGERSRFRRAHGIAGSEFVFLFLSRVDYKKGLDLLLHAFSGFLEKDNTRKIRLVIAGKGTPAYEQYILKLIDQLKLGAHVIYCGFLSGQEKADAYAAADCFVLTSMNENYGISVIEALQADVPVLISDNVYIWKSIVPQGGWVCQYAVHSIEDAIKQVNDFAATSKKPKQPKAVGDQFRKAHLLHDFKRFYADL